ncbi:endo-1,4-beta-xylanase [Microbulbifer sp.]|uniref:endo-1,4-beta-xylanase n=1 Tax=Microbulbifer sp. TaxID=1908541 RepID=UPI003F31C57A
MKFNLFRVVFLAAALVAAGCTNKETEDPDDSAPDVNAPPVADAGADLTVAEGDAVILTGSGTDVDGSIASYNWSQASGPSVTLSTDGAEASFTAPAVEEAAQLVFELQVTDDGGATSEADSVAVMVLPKQEKFFGTATDSDNDYLQLTTYFDQVTPGNAGKWGSVESTRDQMDWQALDTAYNFAKNNGLRYKHHTLIWDQQQPAWLEGLPAAEQLEEIDEWMAAVAARFEDSEGKVDLDMIDVVNEPLHAPAFYKDALGGDGDTGWDWVIAAFELARAHFPDSTLILNDYNILQLKEFTEKYLEVIELLQERELIDGIGVQAHFLEQTSAETVRSNLDLLAATGLPIYVSELDIDFADNARQANKMRDLFSVFWQHPAVAGVTHWGYRQGGTWRPNAWLLNADGTERPALEWLRCFIAEEGDCDTKVPEYQPAGWAGDELRLTLEAELYDQGQGVLASGDIVSHTDLGDWILFQGVEFKNNWDSFSVNYAKGSGVAGSLSVRLDSLDNSNSLSVPLPNTGGWSEFATAEAEWPAIEGSRDVYIRFNEVADVGNIDWLRFGEAGAPQPDVNLVANGDFEQNVAGWNAGWGGGDIEVSTAQAKVGTHSLIAFGFGGGAYAAYNLDVSALTPGTSYPASAWVWISGDSTGRVTLTRKLACEGQSDDYSWVTDEDSIEPQTWTQLQGELTIPADCTPTEVLIYFENTATGTDVHIDDVQVTAPAPAEPSDNLIADGGFEGASLSGWSAWWTGGTSLTLTTEQFHDGAQSMKISERTANSNPSIDLAGEVAAGSSYDVSAWVRHTGPDAVSVVLTRKLACEGEDDSYAAIAGKDGENADILFPANEWTELSGTLEIPADCTVNEARLYFENTPLEVETIYIDDISVTEQ